MNKSDEVSAEDLAEFERLEALYRRLSEGDRYYVVSRWDGEQGLEPTHERINRRNHAPYRQRSRRFWTAIAVIPTLLVLNWIGGLIRADNQRQADSFVLDSLRERSAVNPALKSEIAAGERDYQEYLENLRSEAAEMEH
jgi:hypothetical protein